MRDEPSTVASSGELATHLDERQYEKGDGPCFHAVRTREVTEIPDLRSETRRPDYARRGRRPAA